MKNKNLLIIGAVLLAAFFFFKKKKPNAILPPPPPPSPVDNKFPIDMLEIKATYPAGLTEGMRVIADNGVEQQILENGKIWGLTYDQWAMRGFDAATVISSNILDQIPYGGTYNSI
jgi:hypothetical protein